VTAQYQASIDQPRLVLVFIALVMAWCVGTTRVGAAETGGSLPVNFSADQMDVDRELGIVTARGNVEIKYNDQTMSADTISYNQKADVLTASGNIVLLEPSGEVFFAEHMEITGDLKNGIVKDIRIVLSDRSRIVANGARRINGDLDFSLICCDRKAVYSSCNLCADDPSKSPFS
jgi:LPS-assembly protein